MPENEKRNLIAQWAFDTRSILTRFHLWLDDVEVERSQPDPVSAHAFVPRSIARSLAMTSAATALGTRIFGRYGEGKGKDKQEYNQVKKAADAISAYIMSEGLWQLTRNLPENHAIMVCLGEGLMPKAGETPEMGANPLLGFGRVYARPEVARLVDSEVHRMLNDASHRFETFAEQLQRRGITVWGAAVDTLENTSRFAEGKATGPLAVIHLFDQPLTVTRPYEAYFGCLIVPRPVAETAEARSVMLDWSTPRARLMEIVEATYPGIRREHVHVWTLSGKSRVNRLSRLWDEWKAAGAHLVEDGWKAPTGLSVFTDSGTYAPAFLVRSWKDSAGAQHVFLCDGYAATAEAIQAASLSEVLDVDSSMSVLSTTFDMPHDVEHQLMRLRPHDGEFSRQIAQLVGEKAATDELVNHYRTAIREAEESNVPLRRRALRTGDFLPNKTWRVLACTGHICDDPYTAAPGIEELGNGRYRITTRLATHQAQSVIRFTVRLKDPLEEARLVFSPLLVRFMSGVDWTERAVKISDSGRIRNELQTLISQALDYDGDRIRVHFDRIDEKVLPRASQDIIRRVLQWYKAGHPVWFNWLELA